MTTNPGMPTQGTRGHVDLTNKYLNAQEREILRTGKEPHVGLQALAHMAFGVLMLVIATLLVRDGAGDNRNMPYGFMGAWLGTTLILMGVCGIVSGRSPARLGKFVYGVMAGVGFVGGIAYMVGTAILWMKLKGLK